MLPTLLKSIAVRKGVHPNFIVHSPKPIWYLNTKGVDGRDQFSDLSTISSPSNNLGIQTRDLGSYTTCRTSSATNSPKSNCCQEKRIP